MPPENPRPIIRPYIEDKAIVLKEEVAGVRDTILEVSLTPRDGLFEVAEALSDAFDIAVGFQHLSPEEAAVLVAQARDMYYAEVGLA